ncbi:transposase [Metallumcola ferriviriculae]|uniref:Transposase n=1 Tax=Metallumcola ferriviriculae TaxID=3039180 RepID=A0AAU0UKE2_9FIRM|nr:transposase [Desulfitibacteraceae bacterium MK1]WRO21536.1 transposase [Desulfitibacteraceae bacterium MK1]
MENNFDWVTKAKRNTVLFRKIYDPVLGKNHYVKLNAKQLLREVYSRIRILGKGSVLSIPNIYIKVPYETLTKKGKPITRQRFLPIAAIAATYEEQVAEGSVILPEEECPATFKGVYLLISNRVDAPEEAARTYTKRWKIEVFYRTVKQNLGLTSCYAQSEPAHFAHVELLFTAQTLLCYATWCNKEGAEQAPSLCEVVRYFFNAGCRIRCIKQLIQVYFDTATERFASLIDRFWPKDLELRLWNWDYYPGTA